MTLVEVQNEELDKGSQHRVVLSFRQTSSAMLHGEITDAAMAIGGIWHAEMVGFLAEKRRTSPQLIRGGWAD